MIEVTPLTIYRVHQQILRTPDERATFDNVIELFESFLKNPESPYLLDPTLFELIDYSQTSFSAGQGEEIQNICEQLIENSSSVLAKFNVDDVEQLNEDTIIQQYSIWIKQKVSEFYQRRSDDKHDLYNAVYGLLMDRNIALWAASQKLQFIQLDIVAALYSIDPDLLAYHEVKKLQHLRDILRIKWNEPSVAKQWLVIQEKCNSILDSSMDFGRSNVDVCQINDEVEVCKISEEESCAYWEIQWLTLYAMFLSGEFDQVVGKFRDLSTDGVTNDRVHGSALDALHGFHSSVIDKKGLITSVVLSMVLIFNNKQLQESLQSELFYDQLFTETDLMRFVLNYESLEIKAALKCLSTLEAGWMLCESFEIAFNKIRRMLTHKCLIIFLSMIEEVSLDELQDMFLMKEDAVMKLLKNITVILDLPLVIDGEKRVIQYRDNTQEKASDYLQGIHEMVDYETLRVKAAKLNKVISTVYKETNEVDVE